MDERRGIFPASGFRDLPLRNYLDGQGAWALQHVSRHLVTAVHNTTARLVPVSASSRELRSAGYPRRRRRRLRIPLAGSDDASNAWAVLESSCLPPRAVATVLRRSVPGHSSTDEEELPGVQAAAATHRVVVCSEWHTAGACRATAPRGHNRRRASAQGPLVGSPLRLSGKAPITGDVPFDHERCRVCIRIELVREAVGAHE